MHDRSGIGRGYSDVPAPGARLENQHPRFDLRQFEDPADDGRRTLEEPYILVAGDLTGQDDLFEDVSRIAIEDVGLVAPAPSSACGIEYPIGCNIELAVERRTQEDLVTTDLGIAQHGYYGRVNIHWNSIAKKRKGRA